MDPFNFVSANCHSFIVVGKWKVRLKFDQIKDVEMYRIVWTNRGGMVFFLMCYLNIQAFNTKRLTLKAEQQLLCVDVNALNLYAQNAFTVLGYRILCPDKIKKFDDWQADIEIQTQLQQPHTKCQ
jgi:hypothetical protein